MLVANKTKDKGLKKYLVFSLGFIILVKKRNYWKILRKFLFKFNPLFYYADYYNFNYLFISYLQTKF